LFKIHENKRKILPIFVEAGFLMAIVKPPCTYPSKSDSEKIAVENPKIL
jgi:hypothetical protein